MWDMNLLRGFRILNAGELLKLKEYTVYLLTLFSGTGTGATLKYYWYSYFDV